MSFGKELELDWEAVRRAEQDLETYLASAVYDLDEHKRLLAAVTAARNDYLDQLSTLWPEQLKSV